VPKLTLVIFRRDEFLQHSHPRSLAESTFYVIHAKYGAATRSKRETAQVIASFLKGDRQNSGGAGGVEGAGGPRPRIWSAY
jgi:hypothetical protein